MSDRKLIIGGQFHWGNYA